MTAQLGSLPLALPTNLSVYPSIFESYFFASIELLLHEKNFNFLSPNLNHFSLERSPQNFSSRFKAVLFLRLWIWLYPNPPYPPPC